MYSTQHTDVYMLILYMDILMTTIYIAVMWLNLDKVALRICLFEGFQVSLCCQSTFSADLVLFFSNPFVGFSELNETVPIITNVESESIEEAPTSSSQSEDVRRELVMLSLPAIAGQAIDPLAQLMETAYIGRLGKVELLHIQHFYVTLWLNFRIPEITDELVQKSSIRGVVQKLMSTTSFNLSLRKRNQDLILNLCQ